MHFLTAKEQPSVFLHMKIAYLIRVPNYSFFMLLNSGSASSPLSCLSFLVCDLQDCHTVTDITV